MNRPKSRLFISYSRHDESFTDRLAADLISAGAEVWLDRQSIVPGANWGQSIQEGLDNTDVMLLVVTPESMASNNVALEWQYFFDNNKEIIPLRLKPAKMSFQINRLQYIDFHTSGYQQAFNALCQRLGLREGTSNPVIESGNKPDKALDRHRIRPIDPTEANSLEQDRRTTARVPRNTITAIVAIVIVGGLVGAYVALSNVGIQPPKTPTISPTPPPTQGPSTFTPAPIQIFGVTADVATLAETPTDDNTCSSASARLQVGSQAKVLPEVGEAGLRLRENPGLTGRILYFVNPDVVVNVVDGPVCKDGFRWWKVTLDTSTGWGAEGKDDIYWLKPIEPCIVLPSRLTIGDKARIVKDDLNLRSGPDTSFMLVEKLVKGDVVEVLDGPACASDIRWWKISHNGKIGWAGEAIGANILTEYWLEPVLGN